MQYDLYLKNGTIVTENSSFLGGIVVNQGKISQLVYENQEISAKEIIDLAGKVLLPGVIDEHAHFSEPGREYEGYEYGSRAAAAGGVTTILDMPLNDLPPTIDRVNLMNKRELVKNKSIVDYAHWGGLVNNNLENLEELHKEGVIGYKAFMRDVQDFPRVDDDLLFAGLKKIKELGNIIGVHAENESVTNYLKNKFIAEGRKDRQAWPESRPPFQELEAINRAIYWSRVTGGRLHILHVSISDGIRAIAKAAFEGVPVSAETCAHYLFFNEQVHFEKGPYAKAAPPIRSQEEVDLMWKCVKEGIVDTIASDHSPFPPERHIQGMDDPFKGGGITGIQSILPAIITEGIWKRGLSWSQLSRMMTSNPARIFGLYPQKGSMLPGSDADFAIINPEKKWTLQVGDLYSKYQHSPYVGFQFKGQIEQTIVRGVTVYKNGKIITEPGHGRLYLRN